MLCLGLGSMLLAMPAAAQQIKGQVVGATGTSISSRFGISGSVEFVGQARSSSARFAIAPLAATQRDSIFAGNFETGVP